MTDRNPFRPSWADVHAAVADSRARWAHLDVSHPTDVSYERLREIHAAIRDHAHDLSGGTRDSRRRAVAYFALYEDSARNFMFPLVASHGSMWGVGHTLRLDRALAPLAVASRHGRVDRWRTALDDVRDVNRRVFREVYTTFYFTRFYGRHPRAAALVRPEVLPHYNRAHDAAAAGTRLPWSERRAAYYDVFVHEQGDIVDPGVLAAARAAGPLLVNLTKRVSPRFAYFPGRKRLWFSDFTSVDQRNREGLRAVDFAEEVGPDRVLAALSEYRAA